jgi:hypothetical protein
VDREGYASCGFRTKTVSRLLICVHVCATGHPFVAGRLLERLPELRCVRYTRIRPPSFMPPFFPLIIDTITHNNTSITADVSHWFLACERLLSCPSPSPGGDDGAEARLMLLAAERTDHVRH